MTITRLAFIATAMASLAFAGSAAAQSRTWNFGDITSPGSCPTGGSGPIASTIGNVLTCSSVVPSSVTTSLEVRAFSSTATNSSGTTVTSSGTAGTHFETAAVNYHGIGSGIGVANQFEGALVTGQPNHAMDNSTPGVDLLQLSFVGGIGVQALKTVTLGWGGADSDFQVLRWKLATPAGAVAGRTATELVSDGWERVGEVFNGNLNSGGAHQTFNFNAGGLTSSSWLITAYNSAFGGTGFTSGIDAIKVLSIVATGGTVSAPGTLALVGLGLMGAVAMRRRQG